MSERDSSEGHHVAPKEPVCVKRHWDDIRQSVLTMALERGEWAQTHAGNLIIQESIRELLATPPKLLVSIDHVSLQLPASGRRLSLSKYDDIVTPRERGVILSHVVCLQLNEHCYVNIVVGEMQRTLVDARIESLWHIRVPPRQNYGVTVECVAPQPAGNISIYGWDAP